MAEIAVNQNSTIILPVPLDLLRPFLDTRIGSEETDGRVTPVEEEEAERLYEEAVGEAAREVSSKDVPTERPDGGANS